jgi:molybdopterin converting factor small subunit
MKTINIEYFAVLREHAGKNSEQRATAAVTAGDLFVELRQDYDFPEFSSVKVAVNDEFSSWDAELKEGDSVVFIPPVAGG